MSATDDTTQAASLADAVLTAEAERQAAHEEEEILFADDLLPGVGAEEMTLRRGLTVGGSYTFLMLLLLSTGSRTSRGRHSGCWPRTSGTASASATG